MCQNRTKSKCCQFMVKERARDLIHLNRVFAFVSGKPIFRQQNKFFMDFLAAQGSS